jgi:hypothetical protein
MYIRSDVTDLRFLRRKNIVDWIDYGCTIG